ncbi:type VII secretion target [Actinoplanes sp. NPDC049681]|uniref:type VII secretion target n=1 Tax=Actinoplanes sp. NPDC049681 TaxID=3363905 RepID=UPI0037A9BBF9
MDQLATSLEAAADALTTVDRSLPAHAASPGAFGVDDEGVPGRIGKQLHDHWRAVLTARSREAAETARHLLDLAADVRMTAKTYAETDDETGRRVRRGI